MYTTGLLHVDVEHLAVKTFKFFCAGDRRHRRVREAVLRRLRLLPDAQLRRLLLPLRRRDQHEEGLPRQAQLHRDHLQAQVREGAGGESVMKGNDQGIQSLSDIVTTSGRGQNSHNTQ